MFERITQLPAPPKRPTDAHKGTFGRALIVAGSRGMGGAACLAGLGALRGGAGLVYVAAPKSLLPIIAAVEPSYLTIPLPEDAEGRIAYINVTLAGWLGLDLEATTGGALTLKDVVAEDGEKRFPHPIQ